MQNVLPRDTSLLGVLEDKLSDLASQWRGATRRKESMKAQKLVQQYQATLRYMIELGHDDFLDAETELPDALMPEEYFEWVEQLNAKHD